MDDSMKNSPKVLIHHNILHCILSVPPHTRSIFPQDNNKCKMSDFGLIWNKTKQKTTVALMMLGEVCVLHFIGTSQELR